jgi:hypothetical protein
MTCFTTFSNLRYVLNSTCSRKPSLLVIAAAFSQLQILQWLLQQGADPNICDVFSWVLKLLYLLSDFGALFTLPRGREMPKLCGTYTV